MSVRIRYAIVCDDVRREDTGKLILIGVYAYDVALNSFPANVVLSLAVSIEADEQVDTTIDFRASCNGKSTGEIKGGLNMNIGVALIHIPNFLFTEIQDSGELIFDCRLGGGEWFNIATVPLTDRSNASLQRS